MLPRKFLTPIGAEGSAAVRVILPQHKLDALGSLLGITFDSMGYPSPATPASPVKPTPVSPASPAKQAAPGAPKKRKQAAPKKPKKRKPRTLGNALQACKKRKKQKGAQSTRCLRRAQLVKDL
jgi:hypothetical protein